MFSKEQNKTEPTKPTEPAEPESKNWFIDLNNRKWFFRLTFADVYRVKQDAGVDMLSLIDPESKEADRLSGDMFLIGSALWAALEPQAIAADVSPEQFASGLAGDVLAEAVDALLEGIIDFFPDRARRKILRAARQRIKETDAISVKMAGLIVNQSIGNISGDAPESAESTQEHTPPAS